MSYYCKRINCNCKYCDEEDGCIFYSQGSGNVIDMPCYEECQSLESQRYKPIILQEHDAEPRTMRAILDMITNDIYILETTKGFAEHMGMTIEEVNADGDCD